MLLYVNPWQLCLISKTRRKVLKLGLRLLREIVKSPYHPFLPQQLLLPRKVNYQKRQSSRLHRQDIATVSIQCIHCSVILLPNVFTIGTQAGMQWCLGPVAVSLILLIWFLHLWCLLLAFVSQASHSQFFLPHTGVACHWLDLLAAHQLHLLPETAAVQVIAR
jgi:hypothetical protein